MTPSLNTQNTPVSPSFFTPFKKLTTAMRIFENWKVTFLDCSTVLAVCGVAFTFFNSALTCAAFCILSVACGMSAFYMRQFAKLKSLEQQIGELRAAKQRLETIAADLQRENTRLSQVSAELQRTNQSFQATNQNLNQTNARLTQQVTTLTLHVTQLKESAQRISSEMHRFQQENSHLSHNVRGFDHSLYLLNQEIQTSHGLCQEISQHLASQQQNLGQQLEQLRQYLGDLRAENRILEKIQELNSLNQQLRTAVTDLNNVRIQIGQERGYLEAVHASYVQLRQEFGNAIQQASQEFSTNNQRFSETTNRLDAQLSRVDSLMNRNRS